MEKEIIKTDVSNSIVKGTEEVLEKGDRIGNAIEKAGDYLPDKDSEFIKDLSKRISKIKMNAVLRKKLSKKLSVDEKKSMSWRFVADCFECIDTCRMANEFPKEAANIVRLVMAVLTIFFPVLIPIDIKLAKMEDEKIAKVAMYCAFLTPEHLLSMTTNAIIESNEMSEDEALEYYKENFENTITNKDDTNN